jgi:hypothetical protein
MLHREVFFTLTTGSVVGEGLRFSYDAKQVYPEQDEHTYDAAAFLPSPLHWQTGVQESWSRDKSPRQEPMA